MLVLSVVRAGAEHAHPTMLIAAKAALHRAVASGLIIDGQVFARGADLSLVVSHRRGVGAASIHGLIEGPAACAELEFTERPDEQVVCLFADPTPPGGWNLPLYHMFVDLLALTSPANGRAMRDGFSFEVDDLDGHERIRLDTAADQRELLMAISTPSRYAVRAVMSKTRYLTAAATSARQSAAGPVLIVRAQAGLPTLAEIQEPFTMAGAPAVNALAFRVREGRLVGPRHVFSTDRAESAVAAGAR